MPKGELGDDNRHRWPRKVYSVGQEPDPRFTLANERTFLAWIRTSLAFIATGGAVEFVVRDTSQAIRLVLATGFILLGVTCALTSFLRWAVAERALRAGDPLPAPRLAAVTAVVIAVLGILTLVIVVT